MRRVSTDVTHGHKSPTPRLAALVHERLIDAGLLPYEVSLSGMAERYGRGETSHTALVWWARRPHSAMRALVFASLCRDRQPEALALMTALGQRARVADHVVHRARAALRAQYDRPPRVLDMFAGGGTIPFEAMSLGADAVAVDSNELAVFINRCSLVHSAATSPDRAAELVLASGSRVLADLAVETADVYPLRHAELDARGRAITTYLWSYSMRCEECGYGFHVGKRPWLSRKAGRRIALRKTPGPERDELGILARAPDTFEPGSSWRGRGVMCPRCEHVELHPSLARCREELVALVRSGKRTGKSFVAAGSGAVPADSYLCDREQALLDELGVPLPGTELPRWSGIVNPALYGIRTHAEVLNPRQRIVLLALIRCLRAEYRRLCADEAEDVARFVLGMLSGLIDQCVDWNCRLSMWIPQNEQVGRAFCGPGVSMLWDYAETDPVSRGPSNLMDKLDRIAEGARAIAGRGSRGKAHKGCAQEIPYEDATFDAIVADPPYYDNVYYTVLADFFYSWKRLLLADIEPDLFAQERTDARRELVASTFRFGKEAHETYCHNLALALHEAARVMKPDAVLSLVYSHASLRGWEAIVRAFASAPLEVTSVQPLGIERRQRPRAMSSDAVNTCVVFVARRVHRAKEPIAQQAFLQRAAAVAASGLGDALAAAGWAAGDAALASFAQGAGLLGNFSAVCDATWQDALAGLEELVRRRFPAFKLARRKSL